MNTDDTIAAIASPPGRSEIAIVRISGPRAREVAGAIIPRQIGWPCAQDATIEVEACARAVRLNLPARTAVVGRIITAAAPRSYTGADSAELIIPGNMGLAERVIDALCAHGARRAGPGEFTARAYFAGKLTLDQAEGIAQLIAADRDAELDAARQLLASSPGQRTAGLTDETARLLALVEAGIDFTDQEDVVPIAPADLAFAIDGLIDRLDDRLGPAAGESPSHVPEVALAGPPSAGKSTLFNALLGRARAITDAAPGTTRDVITEETELGGVALRLTDLAGLGESPIDALDAEAQRLAREHLDRADLVLHCDPDAAFSAIRGRPAVRVRTKADRPMPGADADVHVCAFDTASLTALRAAVVSRLGVGPSRSVARSMLLPRHGAALSAARDALIDARAEVDPAERALADPELVASGLRLALDRLGEITGPVSPDEVIGRVFATFCVGK